MESSQAHRAYLASRSIHYSIIMLTMEEAMKQSSMRFAAGEIVKGTVIEVRPKEVLVDIGYKSEGVIPANEFEDIKVVKSLGMGLDEKAMEAVQQWRFRPGTYQGAPVKVRAQIEVNFRTLDKQ